MSGHLTVDPLNRVEIFCAVANHGTTELVQTFSEDFACDDLRLNIINDDLRTESSSIVIATIQYFESTDLTEMTN